MALKKLNEQFEFGPNTLVFENLNRLLVAIESRLSGLEALRDPIDAAIDSLIDVGIQRINESFTPLITEAQQRLETFGANFTAHSTTFLTVGLGAKILSLDEEDRGGYVYADYIAIRRVGGTEYMIAQVDSYDRENGQLFVTVTKATGTGEYNSWDLTISTVPDLTHESLTNNPHQVTAEQVGAYTIAEVDTLLSALSNATLLKTNNLSELVDKPAARANLGSVPSLNDSNTWAKPQTAGIQIINSGVQPSFAAAQMFKATVSGATFNLLNPAEHPADNTFIGIIFTFSTANAISFGNMYKVSNYVPSTSGKDFLCFIRDTTSGLYELIGAKNGITV